MLMLDMLWDICRSVGIDEIDTEGAYIKQHKEQYIDIRSNLDEAARVWRSGACYALLLKHLSAQPSRARLQVCYLVESIE
jgi:hypothetical protein